VGLRAEGSLDGSVAGIGSQALIYTSVRPSLSGNYPIAAKYIFVQMAALRAHDHSFVRALVIRPKRCPSNQVLSAPIQEVNGGAGFSRRF
jgi:hypothetical protein